jgi:hypothetical protein
MTPSFPHEKLDVCPQALSIATTAAALIDSWPTVMAVCVRLGGKTGGKDKENGCLTAIPSFF